MVRLLNGRTRLRLAVPFVVFASMLPVRATAASDGSSDISVCGVCGAGAASPGAHRGRDAPAGEPARRPAAGGTWASLPLVGWLFDTSAYPPRWRCGTWTASLGWLHILSDIAIFSAYTAIPCTLGYFAWRRRDVPFVPVCWLFAAFILFCGLGHLVEAVIFWRPVYALAGVVKLCTAIVSWATVLALIPIIPKLLALPGTAEMNRQLLAEIEQRRASEKSLEQRAMEMQRTNDELAGFAAHVVHREERVIELKEEVNRLRAELGREPSYLQGAHRA